MGRGRRTTTPPGVISSPPSPLAGLEGALAAVIRSVDDDIRSSFQSEVSPARIEAAGGPVELDFDRLAEDPTARPLRLIGALALARSLDELQVHVPALAAAAASAYERHHRAITQAALRPRRATDQELLDRLGADWRLDDVVDGLVRRTRRNADALRRVAEGAEGGPPLDFVVTPEDLRDSRFGQRARVSDALGEPILAAFGAQDTERARALADEALRLTGQEERRAALVAAPESCLETASRLTLAYAELGQDPPFDPLIGIPGLGQRDLDRAGVDRLSGPRAERALPPPPPGQVVRWGAITPARTVAEFEDQARQVIEGPARFDGKVSDDGENVFVPIASPEAFAALRAHYEDHPAFAGYGVLSSVMHGMGTRKAELVVGLRLAYRDEEGVRREVWATLPRGHSAANSRQGRLKACQLAELGLSADDIGPLRAWSRTPVAGHWPRASEQEPALPQMDTSEALTALTACSHRHGRWVATSDHDAVRLTCPDCKRAAITVIPRHRLPRHSSVLPALPELDEPRYLARQRFHAVLAGGQETATSFAEMRERDGIASLLPERGGEAVPEVARRHESMRTTLGRRRSSSVPV